jgi:hypothetical protein
MALTPDQHELIKSAGPGETCMFYGDELLCLSGDRLAAIHEVAFKTAAMAALKELRPDEDDSNMQFECESPALGQMYLRVTVTDSKGAKATAIGWIPDPRAH